jgi:hypothetical protein
MKNWIVFFTSWMFLGKRIDALLDLAAGTRADLAGFMKLYLELIRFRWNKSGSKYLFRKTASHFCGRTRAQYGALSRISKHVEHIGKRLDRAVE